VGQKKKHLLKEERAGTSSDLVCQETFLFQKLIWCFS